MAIDIKEYMKITGLTEAAAKGALARGDEYAEWHMPSGVAKLAARDSMSSELEADDTNAGTIIVETEHVPTQDTGAGEGTDEGDGAELDDLDNETEGEGEGEGETVEE